MRNRLTKLTAAVAALTALAVGGSAIASATQNGSAPKPAQAEQDGKAGASDEATEQTGGVDNDAIEQENGADDATEPAESAQSEAEEGLESEKAEAAENEQEVSGDDGPGGHADEPGNPNADHQFDPEE